MKLFTSKIPQKGIMEAMNKIKFSSIGEKNERINRKIAICEKGCNLAC
jgi:hypothetical protein